MRFRACPVALVGVIGRRAIGDADVVGVDVLVPGRDARDVLARHLLRHDADGIVGRQLLVEDMPLEQELHLVGDEHLRSLVRVSVVDRILCLEGVVFRVDAPPGVLWISDRRARSPAQVLPPPGLLGEAVRQREAPERDAATRLDEPVPFRAKSDPLVVGEWRSGLVVYDILSGHGVLSFDMMLCCSFYHTRVKGAFTIAAAADPMGSDPSLLSFPLPPFSQSVLFLSQGIPPPRQLAFPN